MSLVYDTFLDTWPIGLCHVIYSHLTHTIEGHVTSSHMTLTILTHIGRTRHLFPSDSPSVTYCYSDAIVLVTGIVSVTLLFLSSIKTSS